MSDFAAVVNRGEKIALIGRNGAGKTTLLEVAAPNAPGLTEAPIRHRRRQVTMGTRGGYRLFPAGPTESIRKGMTVIEWLHGFDPAASRQEMRGLLGQMLFSGEER